MSGSVSAALRRASSASSARDDDVQVVERRHALAPLRRVGRATRDGQPERDRPGVGDDDVERRRLRDDRQVARRAGPDRGERPLAAVLLGRHERDEQLALRAPRARPLRRSARTAPRIAATPPFMSQAPRPYSRPSRISPPHGSAVHVARSPGGHDVECGRTGTSRRPPDRPRRPMTTGSARPGISSPGQAGSARIVGRVRCDDLDGEPGGREPVRDQSRRRPPRRPVTLGIADERGELVASAPRRPRVGRRRVRLRPASGARQPRGGSAGSGRSRRRSRSRPPRGAGTAWTSHAGRLEPRAACPGCPRRRPRRPAGPRGRCSRGSGTPPPGTSTRRIPRSASSAYRPAGSSGRNTTARSSATGEITRHQVDQLGRALPVRDVERSGRRRRRSRRAGGRRRRSSGASARCTTGPAGARTCRRPRPCPAPRSGRAVGMPRRARPRLEDAGLAARGSACPGGAGSRRRRSPAAGRRRRRGPGRRSRRRGRGRGSRGASSVVDEAVVLAPCGVEVARAEEPVGGSS